MSAKYGEHSSTQHNKVQHASHRIAGTRIELSQKETTALYRALLDSLYFMTFTPEICKNTRASLPITVGILGCLLPVAVTVGCSGSYILIGCVTITSAAVLSTIAVTSYNNRRTLSSITDLIAEYEKFDNAMKRYFIFIKEIVAANAKRVEQLYTNSSDNSVYNCMQNCRRANHCIHIFEEALEARMKLHEQYNSIIEPIEPLTEDLTEELKTFNQKNAKKLYHIFLYMQSHCLLRLGLAIASDGTALASMHKDLRRLTIALAECTGKLLHSICISARFEPRLLERAQTYEKQMIPEEMVTIRNQSLELAVKLSAAAKQMETVDDELHLIKSTSDRKRLQETETYLVAIQTNLLTRSDDCERILINVKKLLNKVYDCDNNMDHDIDVPTVANETEYESGQGRHLFAADTVIEQEDEFFVLTGEEVEPLAGGDGLQAVEDKVAERLRKRQFQPVLQQLRERLQPIDVSFREREKAAMRRKGIELDEDASQTKDEEEIDYDEDVAARLPPRTQNRYDEGRSFLASKEQLNFFASSKPQILLDESILE